MRKRRELLARALREEAAEEAEETAEGSEEEPRPAKPVVQKLVPDKIQKQLEAAEAAVEQVWPQTVRINFFLQARCLFQAHCAAVCSTCLYHIIIHSECFWAVAHRKGSAACKG